MTLGEAFTIRFQQLLKEKNVSLHRFLKDNCIARSTIVNIIKGNTKCPTLAIIYQVADGFQMSPLEFLDNDVFKREDLEYM
ncbi:MAG: hypothetical protein SO434_02270 [Eubacteriales bacterium]|nr:hypothetical protein [Eubacteriales bacterium]